jgi:prophage DNA circulation protein
MKIEHTVHVYHHPPASEALLESILQYSKATYQKVTHMADAFADVETKVTEITGKIEQLPTIAAGIETAFQHFADNNKQLSDQLAALIAAGGAIDPARVKAVSDQLAADAQTLTDNAARISAAIVANTPAAPTT